MIKLNIIITSLCVIITTMISIILHQIENVDILFWYIIVIPFIIIRLIRTILLIKPKNYDTDP